MSANNVDVDQQPAVAFVSIFEQPSQEQEELEQEEEEDADVRPYLRIDARGDIRQGFCSIAGGDSNEAVTQLLRRRTMEDIVRRNYDRRRNSETVASMWWMLHPELGQNPKWLTP